MYNLTTHYTSIFNLVNSIISHPSIQYLHPFGSTEIKNIEYLSTQIDNTPEDKPRSKISSIVFCYDQEPLLANFNKELFNHVTDTTDFFQVQGKLVILLNTELDSDDKDKILSEFNFVDCYYFHHIFAAHDWFRGYYYDKHITNPADRKLSKKFITFNRLTSNARVYRTLLINELINYNLLDDGYVSYSKECPQGGNFDQQLINNADQYNISPYLVQQSIHNINHSIHSFRVDFTTNEYIPNRSFSIDSIDLSMESFLYIVTETNYWGRRKHLTEKIFKPIILKQPFILVGCAYNLDYLKSYGFKTFDHWWSEDYDNITDDIERMKCIGQTIDSICKLSLSDMELILQDMQETLEYNFNLFYSRDFIDSAWKELETNLTKAIDTACRTDKYKEILFNILKHKRLN